MNALVPVTPDAVAVRIGPLPVHWYGIGYAVGLAVGYVVMTREARRRGLDPRFVDTGMIVVTLAGIVGARAYHVVDQWDRYRHDPLAVVLPPYTGLGVLGAIIAGGAALAVLVRRRRQDFWRWSDVVAPGAFAVQAFARWGNFFNQELYGPPTHVPWGIAIDCAHRVAAYPCDRYPQATTGFQPLFGYESVSGAAGAVVLLLVARRVGHRLRPGDLFLAWLVWYCVVRIALEGLRSGSWAVGGVPTATLICSVLLVAALAVLAWRHRPAARSAQRWGEPTAVG